MSDRQQEFLTHVTIDGDRYEALSQRYFGTPLRGSRIIAANPDAPIASFLPGGIALLIPIPDDGEIIDDSELPPWRRSALR
jgi:phage tail protein X